MLHYPVGSRHDDVENVYPVMGKENGERLFGMPPKTPGAVSKRQPFTPAIGRKEKSKIGGSTPVRKALGSIGNLIGTSGGLRPADTGLSRRDGLIKPTITSVERANATAGQKDTSSKTTFTPSLLKPKKSSKQDVPAKMVTESKAEVNQGPEDPIRRRAEQFAEGGIEHVSFSGDALQALLKETAEREIAVGVKAALSCRAPWPSFRVIDKAPFDDLVELPSEPVSPLNDGEHLQYHDFHSASEVCNLFDEELDASFLPDLPDDFGMEYGQSPVHA